jgi:hypothetical protein
MAENIWPRLAAPVDPQAIAWRQDGKPMNRDGRHYARFVCYIEANTVRERLDSVCPGEWDLHLEPLPVREVPDRNGVVEIDPDTAFTFKARLTVAGVVREDVGHGKDWKQAATDAFKRAAVRFGIGHELYDYEQNWVEVDGDGRYAKPVEDPGVAYARRHGKDAPSAQERVAQSRPTSRPSSTPATTDSTSTNPRAAGAAGDTTASATADEAACPKCGGRMWDNRATKRNPKAPDYKCRDQNCDGVIWPPKHGKSTKSAPRTRGNAMDAEDVPPPEPPPFDDEPLPF